MKIRRPGLICLFLLGSAMVPAAAHADSCVAKVGNGAGGNLVEISVRAEFASPGSEADRNLPLPLPRPLAKEQTAVLEWSCPSNKISYIVTGTFANGIKAASAPITPRRIGSSDPDTAWLQ
jgi:hypothetical protein